MGRNIIWSLIAFGALWFLIVKLVWGVRENDEKVLETIGKITPTGIIALYGALAAFGAVLNGYVVSRISSRGTLGLVIGACLAILLPVCLVKGLERAFRDAVRFYNSVREGEALEWRGGDAYTVFLLMLLCEGALGLFFGMDTQFLGYHVLTSAAFSALFISAIPMRWLLKGTEEERRVYEGARRLREGLEKERSQSHKRTLYLTEILVLYLILSSRTRAFYALALGAGCGLYLFLIMYDLKGISFLPERRVPKRVPEHTEKEAAEMKKTFAGLKETFQKKTKHLKGAYEEKKEERREEKVDRAQKDETGVKSGKPGGIVYFARHGESTLGAQNLICGATDAPLTEKGRAQAEKLAEDILAENRKIDCILSSPLKRAYETAEIVGEKLKIPVKTDARLREQDFGIWEETDRNQAAFLELKKNPAESFNGGENLLKVSQRVYAVLDELKDRDVTCLIVSHNGVARVMAAYFETLDGEAFYHYTIDNASLKAFDYRRIGQAPIKKASDVVVREAFDEIEKLASFVEEKGEK